MGVVVVRRGTSGGSHVVPTDFVANRPFVSGTVPLLSQGFTLRSASIVFGPPESLIPLTVPTSPPVPRTSRLSVLTLVPGRSDPCFASRLFP